jgi:hypothetical protein
LSEHQITVLEESTRQDSKIVPASPLTPPLWWCCKRATVSARTPPPRWLSLPPRRVALMYSRPQQRQQPVPAAAPASASAPVAEKKKKRRSKQRGKRAGKKHQKHAWQQLDEARGLQPLTSRSGVHTPTASMSPVPRDSTLPSASGALLHVDWRRVVIRRRVAAATATHAPMEAMGSL